MIDVNLESNLKIVLKNHELFELSSAKSVSHNYFKVL